MDSIASIVIHHPFRSQVIDGELHYISEPINAANADDVRHFIATYNRALRHAQASGVRQVDIHLGERTTPKYHKGRAVMGEEEGADICHDEGGWLEHILIVQHTSGSQLTIGAIQRKPGESSEFHS